MSANFCKRPAYRLATGFVTLLLIGLLTGDQLLAQKVIEANYDEAKVPDYQLPNPLVTAAGQAVQDASTWNTVRRPELLELFQKHVYGRSPAACEIRSEVVSETRDAWGGQAVRREIDVFFGTSPDAPSMRLLVYTPHRDQKVPAFIGLNFQGNHTVDPDSTIQVATSWVRDRKDETTDKHRALAAGRGVAAGRWPIETILSRGYGLVTIYYGDIDPDYDDGFENGIHGLFSKWSETIPAGERWGSIAAWAYGLSRALDYLQTDALIDGERVAVMGHSRLGKTSLWAGATDPRFKLVISNDSGCGGAALSRRAVGETVGRINHSFPHWFCDNFTKFNENEAELPIDQHQLLALIAPRPLYVASASEDRWADPKGEFLSTVAADPVYRLLGAGGFGGDAPPSQQPAADKPIKTGAIGYHLRSGEHSVTEFDWAQYLDFADRHL